VSVLECCSGMTVLVPPPTPSFVELAVGGSFTKLW
jgi:hypothetical protein